MAVKIKSKSSAGAASGNSAAALLAKFQKQYGDSVGSFGGSLVNSERLPTGMFPLDLALGGGFPRGKCTIIYGPESSGKTNLALLAIAQHQRMFPELVCFFIDIEQSYDPEWAAKLGVDTEKVIVLRPSYAEQAVDMVEAALYTEDCGVVVMDSLAAMVTTQELESSAEKANVGGTGLVTGKLVRKTTLALGEAEKAGRYPTLIYINQIRMKIGVMFGNPETMPGGNAPLFQAAIRLRVYGKNIMDAKVSSAMPVCKETNFALQKWKCPVLAATGQFTMVTIPHKGMPTGFCDDFNTVSEYLKGFGMFEKGANGKGWDILGEHYNVIKDWKDKFYGDPNYGAEVRAEIIAKLVADGQGLGEDTSQETAVEQ